MSLEVRGKDSLYKQLAAFKEQGQAAMERAVVLTIAHAQQFVIQKITSDIAPHSGMGRRVNPQPVVTDLVDTGRLRSSWVIEFPAPLTATLSTNVKYAKRLEYGFQGTVNIPAHKVKSHFRTYKGRKVKISAHSRKGHAVKVNQRGFFFLRATKVEAAKFLNKTLVNELRGLA